MAKPFVLSDESINDRGYRILTKGINLDRFKKNPIMLWMHRRDDGWDFNQVLPIGKWENIRIEDGKLLAEPVFDENDKFASLIKSKVESDLIKGCSIGINPVEFSTDAKDLEKGQTRATITKSELYEASIVDLPSNKNTVRLFSKSDSSNEDDFIPILNNSKMHTPENQFSFKSEDDFLNFVKSKFGLEPVGSPKEDPKPNDDSFSFANENSLMQWFKKKFNISLKTDTPEKPADDPSQVPAGQTLKTKPETPEKPESKTKEELESEIQSLNEKLAALKSAPGAESHSVPKETDGSPASSGDSNFNTYASALETWNAIDSIVD